MLDSYFRGFQHPASPCMNCQGKHNVTCVLRWMQVPEDSFAFLVDADFVLVKDFAAKLKQGTSGSLLRYVANAWKERSERHAVIVPAFQREPEEDGDTHEEHACASSLAEITPDSDCWRYDRYEAPLTQTALHRMLEDGSITGFYEDKVRSKHHVCSCVTTKPACMSREL